MCGFEVFGCEVVFECCFCIFESLVYDFKSVAILFKNLNDRRVADFFFDADHEISHLIVYAHHFVLIHILVENGVFNV